MDCGFQTLVVVVQLTSVAVHGNASQGWGRSAGSPRPGTKKGEKVVSKQRAVAPFSVQLTCMHETLENIGPTSMSPVSRRHRSWLCSLEYLSPRTQQSPQLHFKTNAFQNLGRFPGGGGGPGVSTAESVCKAKIKDNFSRCAKGKMNKRQGELSQQSCQNRMATMFCGFPCTMPVVSFVLPFLNENLWRINPVGNAKRSRDLHFRGANCVKATSTQQKFIALAQAKLPAPVHSDPGAIYVFPFIN